MVNWTRCNSPSPHTLERRCCGPELVAWARTNMEGGQSHAQPQPAASHCAPRSALTSRQDKIVVVSTRGSRVVISARLLLWRTPGGNGSSSRWRNRDHLLGCRRYSNSGKWSRISANEPVDEQAHTAMHDITQCCMGAAHQTLISRLALFLSLARSRSQLGRRITPPRRRRHGCLYSDLRVIGSCLYTGCP